MQSLLQTSGLSSQGISCSKDATVRLENLKGRDLVIDATIQKKMDL
jgi:hypothetical protein